MCGTPLEARVEARRPAGAPVPNLPRIVDVAEPPLSLAMENATKPANNQAPPLGGPPVADLTQPGINQSSPNQPSSNQPSVSSPGEKSFSVMDSFSFAPEQSPERSKTGALRNLLLVALLAALGVAGWWTYTNYFGVGENRKPAAAASTAGQASAGTPATKPAAPANDATSPQAAPSAGTAGGQPEMAPKNASAASRPAGKTATARPKPEAGPAASPKIKVKMKAAPARAAADTGDAAFRKGEAYLYGRGVPKNCDAAVKYLKAASAKSNAKARIAFGTMYATGHCVPRDLPKSYSWFALALRANPNNQILEKDLSAVWNQMTPPERQMATRMKQ